MGCVKIKYITGNFTYFCFYSRWLLESELHEWQTWCNWYTRNTAFPLIHIIFKSPTNIKQKEHLILIQVQSSKKMRILNLNVPNNITSKYQYIKTNRNRKGVTAEFIIPVGDVKDTSLVELGSLVRSHLQPWSTWNVAALQWDALQAWNTHWILKT